MEQVFEHRQTQIVRTFQTRAEADLLAMTLIAHGIPAHVYESGSQYPSLDWVEGIKVIVAADDLERALKSSPGPDWAACADLLGLRFHWWRSKGFRVRCSSRRFKDSSGVRIAGWLMLLLACVGFVACGRQPDVSVGTPAQPPTPTDPKAVPTSRGNTDPPTSPQDDLYPPDERFAEVVPEKFLWNPRPQPWLKVEVFQQEVLDRSSARSAVSYRAVVYYVGGDQDCFGLARVEVSFDEAAPEVTVFEGSRLRPAGCPERAMFKKTTMTLDRPILTDGAIP